MELLIGAHDPEGRMTKQIEYLKPTLQLFDSTIAAITPSSVPEVQIKLGQIGIDIVEGSSLLHETKLVMLESSRSSVFCTELDKLLHFQMFFPDELEAISRMDPVGFTLFGRTQRAFDTYPDSCKVNESIANRAMVETVGIPDIDIAVGDFIADRLAVDLLKNKPALEGCECCVEMPADVILAGLTFRYVSLDVFEWEDPDRYQEEIQREGFENWKRRLYDSWEEWQKRRDQLKDYLTALGRFRARLGLPVYHFSGPHLHH